MVCTNLLEVGKMQKSKRNTLTVLLLIAITAIMCAAISVGGMLQSGMRVSAAATGWQGVSYYSDYSSQQETYEAGFALSKQLAEEGYVLLKNEVSGIAEREGAKALPLASDTTKLNLFGRNSYDPETGGSGSAGSTMGEIITITGSLKNAGYTINPALEEFYNAQPKRVKPSSNRSFYFTGETPQSDYPASLADTYAEYGDVAVVTFTRSGGEGTDLSRASFTTVEGSTSRNDAVAWPTRDEITSGTWTPKGGKGRENTPFAHYLELDENELALLDMLQKNNDIKDVIVLINTSNIMELGFLNDAKYSKIKSALWIPGGGVSGFDAIGKILKGEVNPSGRTVDTHYSDFTKDPSWFNFGNNRVGQNKLGQGNQYTTEEGTIYDGITFNSCGGTLYEVSYEEGIYLGYRYYETRGYTDGEDWYDDAVVYPFGHGLSYSDFDWEITGVRQGTFDSNVAQDESTGVVGRSVVGAMPVSDWTQPIVFDSDDAFEIDVKVTNRSTSAMSGKDVVEMYYTAPYETDKIEKSHVELGDFAKTDLIAPGESDTVTLTIRAIDLASYDFGDKNTNGHSGWELDDGDYTLWIGKDAHDAWASEDPMKISLRLNTEVNYTKDWKTDYTVENRFDDVSEAMEDRTLSRTDWEGTFPTTPYWFDVDADNTVLDPFWEARFRFEHDGEAYSAEEYPDVDPVYLKAGKAELVKPDEFFDDFMLPVADGVEQGAARIAEWYDEANPRYPDAEGNPGHAPWYCADEDAPEFRDSAQAYSASDPAPIQYIELAGKSYDDPMWEQFLSQMTVEQMIDVMQIRWLTAIDGLGIPAGDANDGPVGIKGRGWGGPFVSYPVEPVIASTWNKELAYRQGNMIGNEALWSKITGWWAPGANIHRSPFSGRNFEYYSECGTLSGFILSQVVRGATDKGVLVNMKHFVLNDQETDRGNNGIATWADEQTMRQIYFKPFEDAIKLGNGNGAMTSYNRIGTVWAGAHYELLTEVVRNEWGMDGGIFVTDSPNISSTHMYSNQMIRAGNDMSLCNRLTTTPARLTFDEASLTATHKLAIWNSTKNILYTYLKCNLLRNGYYIENMDMEYTAGGADANSAVSLTAVKNVATEISVADEALSGVKYIMHNGELPEGMDYDAETGTISGTPTESGTFSIQIAPVSSDIDEGEEWTATVRNYFTLTVYDSDAELIVDQISEALDQLKSEYEGKIDALTEQINALDEKLAALNNYDDAALRAQIEELKTQLESLGSQLDSAGANDTALKSQIEALQNALDELTVTDDENFGSLIGLSVAIVIIAGLGLVAAVAGLVIKLLRGSKNR